MNNNTIVTLFVVVFSILASTHQLLRPHTKIAINDTTNDNDPIESVKPSTREDIKIEPSLNVGFTLNEANSMSKSNDKYWWLNSGGKAVISSTVIKTLQGELNQSEYWAKTYKWTNPSETDNGQHPQNIFRLVSRSKYQNVEQSMYFIINKYILSTDVHRTASNGVLFFHHYQDGNNLYYAGLRVDGTGVIKKKIYGKYYTMAQVDYADSKTYDREHNPNLLPTGREVGLKTEIRNVSESTVNIKLYVDIDNTKSWILLAEASDDGTQYGGKAITKEGYVGIRSDFMDAEFNDYKAK